MARGRKPQPAAVNEAKGNPGRRRRSARLASEAPPKGAPPPELNDQARRIWEAIAPELTRLNFLRDIDRQAFARYCVHLARWWDLTQDLAAHGETYVTESNHGTMERVRPAFIVRERTEKRLEVAEDRFGLNPASRQQIMQRLAGLVPAGPTGNLFGQEGDNGTDRDRPPDPPSPVGLLTPGPSVH